jgi:hypothetical protein
MGHSGFLMGESFFFMFLASQYSYTFQPQRHGLTTEVQRGTEGGLVLVLSNSVSLRVSVVKKTFLQPEDQQESLSKDIRNE